MRYLHTMRLMAVNGTSAKYGWRSTSGSINNNNIFWLTKKMLTAWAHQLAIKKNKKKKNDETTIHEWEINELSGANKNAIQKILFKNWF